MLRVDSPAVRYATANPRPIYDPPADAICELVDRRTQTGKSFLLRSGLHRQIVTIGHQHYHDGERWQDVDNRVVSAGDRYECWRTSYIWMSHQTGIGCNYKSRAGGFARAKLLTIGGEVPRWSKAEADDNRLHYDGVAPATDFHWQLLPSKVAGWVTVHNASAPREWTWEYIHSDGVVIARTRTGQDSAGRPLEIECDIETEELRPGLYRTRLIKRWIGRVADVDRSTRRRQWSDDPAYPVCIDPDISEQITAENDDGREYIGTATGWANSQVRLGWQSSPSYKYNPGLRFQGVNVPQGDVIELANLKIKQYSNVGSGGGGTIYAWDRNSALAWSSTNRPSQLTRTTASASWPASTSNTQKSFTVTSIVQELVDRGGWSSGNHIGLFALYSSSSGNWSRFDDYPSSGNHGRLEIDYSAPASGNPGAALLMRLIG